MLLNSCPELYLATKVMQKFYQLYIKELFFLQEKGLEPDSTSLQQPFYATASLAEFPYIFQYLNFFFS